MKKIIMIACFLTFGLAVAGYSQSQEESTGVSAKVEKAEVITGIEKPADAEMKECLKKDMAKCTAEAKANCKDKEAACCDKKKKRKKKKKKSI